MRYLQLSLLFFVGLTSVTFCLQEGFVYLDNVDKTIQTSLRYFSSENFVGAIIDGYKTNRVIMTKEAAEALSKVQKELLQEGYSLVIYDAYRPQKAVNHFIRWSKDTADVKMKLYYYPDFLEKEMLFNEGYIGRKSGHSRGSTIDLTIIKITDTLHQKPSYEVRSIVNRIQLPFLNDHTVDMGCSFDFFGTASHHDSKDIPNDYLKQRNYLKAKMAKYNFRSYENEWWHYTLDGEPFPDTYFDFDIE